MPSLLPLFPLNTVLFPGMPLTLHIFEERYKLMISRCIEADEPFGVVLIRSGSEVQGFGPSAEPYRIGCTAQITQVQSVGLGRMNIIAIGRERFRVLSLDDSTQPYLQGETEVLPTLHPADPQALAGYDQHLRPWVERYLDAIAKAENIQFDTRQLPSDAVSLAYLSASLLRIGLAEKQELLSINSALDLVQQVASMYRKEATLLQVLLEQREKTAEPPNGVFSVN